MKRFRGVTAIIPTYNRAAFIGECIDALLLQADPPEQVIVLDDGSTDDTRMLVGSYQGRVDYHWQPNAGKSAALNRALTIAKHDYIWIFDDDDIAAEGSLQLLRQALDASGDCGFAFGRYDNFSVSTSNVKQFRIPHTISTVNVEILFQSLLYRNFIFQPSMLVRRSCYDQLGPFDTAFARSQDYDMLLRLSASFKAQFIDKVLFHQRQHYGDRGPANLRISGHEIWQRQVAFDDRVIAKNVTLAALAAYLPWQARLEEMSPLSQLEAVLVRSAFHAHRENPTDARRDLLEATRLLEVVGELNFLKILEKTWNPLLERVATASTLSDARSLIRVIGAINISRLASYASSKVRTRTLANARRALLAGRPRRTLRYLLIWSMARRAAMASLTAGSN